MVTDRCREQKQGSPSFFKVVRYPSHLPLPTAFVRRYAEKIPKNSTLKTATGNHSWKLKIEKMGEDYCFTHGWDKLVEDTQLRIKDLIVFWLIDSFTFQVSFYGSDGCEKNLQLDNTSDGEDDDDSDENLGFQRVISEKAHKYTMSLPRKFVEAAGLENKTGIRLKDHEGKVWSMGLLAESHEKTKCSLSMGWSMFREYHKLADGDMCSFKFSKKEGVLIIEQMLRLKRKGSKGPKVDEGLKRKRGRPRLQKPGGGAEAKIEYDSSPEAVKKKKGRPPFEKHGGGGGGIVNVKIEDVSGVEAETETETEVVKKRKRGRPRVEKPSGGGGGVNVKVEDEPEPEPEATEVVKERPLLEKGRPSGGVDVKIEDELVVVVKRKRGRPPLKKPGSGGGAGANNVEVVQGPPVENTGCEVEVKRKRGRPPLKKPGDGGGGASKVEVVKEPPVENTGYGVGVEVKRKRGRPRKLVRSEGVIYF